MTKGERVKQVRLLSGHTVVDFAEICNANLETYKTWEYDRKYGLSKKGASIISKCVLNLCNIKCSPEWLTNGDGYEPFRVKQNSAYIESELSLFISHHSQCLTFVLDTDFDSTFTRHDTIAGECLPTDILSLSINKLSIIQTQENSLCIGVIKKIMGKEVTILGGKKNKINIAYLKIAPVIWHRKISYI